MYSQSLSRRREDGAAAVEFAFIVPLLVLLFFGIVYFGLSIFRQQVIESAAREGARVASLAGTADEVEAAVDAAATGFGADEVTATVVESCTDIDGDAVVRVVADSDRFTFYVPFLNNDSGGTVDPTFTANATFECEMEL